jgi:hypothetical protein
MDTFSMIEIAEMHRRAKARAERQARQYARARMGVILLGLAVVAAMVVAILTEG